MEVMLERVQFKFASIIGELCSEPLVLSQFAVWVDMRLAEYKLKGSISLDCSGDSPDPVWMKGITFALTEKLKEAQLKAAKAQAVFGGAKPQPRTGIGQSDSRIPSYHDGPSLSEITQDVSDNVIVKAEPVDDQDIYPLDLYANSDQTESPSVRKDRRKRPLSISNDMTSLYTLSGSEPVPKTSRLSMDDCKITEVTSDVDNTSLLSIIGLNTSHQDNHASTSQNVENVTLDGDDSIQEYLSSPRQMGDNSSIIPSQQGSSNHVWQSDTTIDSAACSWLSNPQHHFSMTPGRVMSPQSINRSSSLAGQIRSYVKKFEKWALTRPQPEMRKIETIPPEELDPLLAVFFTTIRKDSGGAYGYQSLITLRAGLERHLKHYDYQYSLRNSQEFKQSQTALRMRKYGGSNLTSPNRQSQTSSARDRMNCSD